MKYQGLRNQLKKAKQERLLEEQVYEKECLNTGCELVFLCIAVPITLYQSYLALTTDTVVNDIFGTFGVFITSLSFVNGLKAVLKGEEARSNMEALDSWIEETETFFKEQKE